VLEQFFAEKLEAGLGEAPGAVEGAGDVGGDGADLIAELARLGDGLERGGAEALVLARGVGRRDYIRYHDRHLGSIRE
jgi:hypothetical protein